MTKREKEDAAVFDFVQATLRIYADRFDIRLRGVARTKPTNSLFGSCYPNGKIVMTVRWKSGKPLHAYSLVDTMAHELAHLRYFSHSQRWAELYSRIFFVMVRDGVYQRLRPLVKRKA
jgi:predicted metal-dependent hydrolase